ncbi:MAG TPA: hypothetical protein VN972_05625 [Methylomirabilota bacterium]|nr:hypothetical protein [Methylomirabilota bacterium]
MNAEAVAIGRAKTYLPGVADYLRQVAELGRRSLRPALPALAFLYFYRVGVGAYMALSDYSYPLGKDAMTDIVPQMAVIATFVPLLLLVYTPFLPLQDGVLQGRPMSFAAAIRRVLETAWNFTLSGIAQAIVFFIPFLAVCFIAGLALPESGGEADPSRTVVFLLALLIAFAWGMVAGTLLMFATPALVLDDEGPIQSIRTSVRLVLSNLGGVVGRLFAFAFLAIVFYVAANMPSWILGAAERASGVASAPLKIAGVVWTSGVVTIAFPFWVAALMVLYRSLMPRAAEARGGAPVAHEDEFRAATAANAPFE